MGERLVLESPLRAAMDVASAAGDSHILRTRESMGTGSPTFSTTPSPLANFHRQWLVRKGRVEDAKKALLRLTSLNRESDFDADETVAMIAHTTSLEDKITAGSSYLDCFKGVDLRRTEIICMVWAIQNLSGNSD